MEGDQIRSFNSGGTSNVSPISKDFLFANQHINYPSGFRCSDKVTDDEKVNDEQRWEKLAKNINNHIHEVPTIADILRQTSLFLNSAELKDILNSHNRYFSENTDSPAIQSKKLIIIIDDLERISNWIYASIDLIGK